jgi:glycine dehydrogenase subunit 1
MADYLSNTIDQQTQMLKEIGLNSLEELYANLPQDLILQKPLNLALGQSEFSVFDTLKELSSKNKVYKTILRGAGVEQHYIPSVVKQLSNREEFVSAYTPYQSELSQGILQSIFEYQSSMCEITGMDVCNASVYDGATAAAEAIQMVIEKNRRKILVPKNIHPHVVSVMRTYTQWLNVEIVDVECKDGVVDMDDLRIKCDETTAALFIQHPNYFGLLEDVMDISQMVHSIGAKLVQYTNPMTLGYLKTPRANGVDIAIGEAQPLGIPMSYGGPFLGYMAASAELVRRLPGRIVGQTLDENGKRAFTLTLQAREQHIRREKASSSICSNQALMALTASMYLASVGPSGLKEVAEYSMRKAHYFANELIKLGFKLKYTGPYFHEFVTVSPVENTIIERALDEINVLSGLSLSSHETLWCCTETIKKGDIDRVVSRLKEVLV